MYNISRKRVVCEKILARTLLLRADQLLCCCMSCHHLLRSFLSALDPYLRIISEVIASLTRKDSSVSYFVFIVQLGV